jgi:hypothetical protein
MEHYDIDAITDAVMFELEATGGWIPQVIKDAAKKAKDGAKDGVHRGAVIIKKRGFLADLQKMLKDQNNLLETWKTTEHWVPYETQWDSIHNRNHAMSASILKGTSDALKDFERNLGKQLKELTDMVPKGEVDWDIKENIHTLTLGNSTMQAKWKEYVEAV